jgi:DNA-directed RNA polymerase subunit F
MKTNLTYEKKTMSIYHEDLEYLRSLEGDNLSDKLRNLIRKEKQNNELLNKIADVKHLKNQDFTFELGEVNASCSFESIWEVVEFMKKLNVIMSKEEILEFMKVMFSSYMDCELNDLAPAKLELHFD